MSLDVLFSPTWMCTAVFSLCEWSAVKDVGVWTQGGVTPYQEGNRLGGRPFNRSLTAKEWATSDYISIINHRRDHVPPLYSTIFSFFLSHSYFNTYTLRNSPECWVWLGSTKPRTQSHSFMYSQWSHLVGDIWRWQLWPTLSLIHAGPHARAVWRLLVAQSLGLCTWGSLCCTLSMSFPPFLHCQIRCAWLCAKVNTGRTYLPYWKLRAVTEGAARGENEFVPRGDHSK